MNLFQRSPGRFAQVVGLVTLLLAAQSVRAGELHVSNVAGQDHYDGRSPVSRGSGSGPCRTIGRALALAQKGDRIVLAATGQPYCESITLQAARNSGFINEPFEIAGNGAVLDGTAPVPESAWEHVEQDLYRFPPPRKSHQLLFLGGKPAERVAVSPESAALPELKPLQWCLFEREVYFCCEAGRTPGSYPLSYAHHPVGITLYDVRHVSIRDLVVQGYQLDGVNAHDNVFDAVLSGLTCRGNARSGIAIGGACQVKLEGCLLGNNGAAQLRTGGQSRTVLKNCDLLENTAPPIVSEGGTVRIDSADGR